MKDAIKGMVKRGLLFKYVKGGKREREESPKSKCLSKAMDVGTSGGDMEASK